jgi:hypothetical protein
MDVTVSRSSLLIDTPTTINRLLPDAVWEITRLALSVEPDEKASICKGPPGAEVDVGVGVSVGGSGVNVGPPGVGEIVAVGGMSVFDGSGVIVGGRLCCSPSISGLGRPVPELARFMR